MGPKVGETKSVAKVISAEEIHAFADFSGDKNPIHVDRQYAMNHGFEGRVAHGLIPLSYLSSLLTETMGEGNVILSLETKFSQPVIEGTEVLIELTLDNCDERFGTYNFKFKITDRNTGNMKIRGKVTCLNKNLQAKK